MMDWLQGEPTLKDVLSDPVVQALMARDRVDRASLKALARTIARYRGDLSDPPPKRPLDSAA